MLENPVRASTLIVINQAKNVRINREKIEKTARLWQKSNLLKPSWPSAKHLENKDEKTILTYIILVDTLNFCFWNKDESKRWSIKHKNKKEKGTRPELVKGYFALSLALKDFFETHPEKSNFEFLAKIPFQDFKAILRGGRNLYFLKERWDFAKKVSRFFIKKYQGNPVRFIAEANKKCRILVPKIAKGLPSFGDTAEYKGKKVYFWKRAQILISDIWGAFRGRGIGEFTDLEWLTAFADYKLPQILHHWGILEYSKELEAKIKNRKLIKAGSGEEIEIRSATIWAVEHLKEEVNKLGSDLKSFEIDWFLWNKSKEKPLPVSYHLTKTTFY